MLTVFAEDKTVFDSLCAGACGYITKNASPEQIMDAVREVKRGVAPISPRIARMVVQALQQPKPRTMASDQLSKRQNELLSLLAQGYSYKEIAETMSISAPTVNNYIRRIYEKLHVQSRGQAVAIYANLIEKKS